MHTTEFLSRVLPSAGTKALWQGKSKENEFFASVAELADAALAYDAAGYTVYHGCAGYDGKGRKKENAIAFRSFWIDIDCGYDKNGTLKKYLTQDEGRKALVAFLHETNLPAPMLVNSGNGLHAYWVLDADIGPDDWYAAALGLKDKCVALGFHVDHGCTEDKARVLRPVGTHNRKGEPKPVTLLEEGGIYPAGALVALLKSWQGDASLSKAARAVFGDAGNDLGGGVEFPPSSAHIIVEHCAQLRHVRDTGGNVEYPVWRAALGLLKHTVEGRELCHEWSKGYPEYKVDETDRKIDDWNTGPATCAEFEKHAPERCKECPSKGITSPIRLGHTLPESEGVEMEPPERVEEADPNVLPALPSTMENIYSLVDGRIMALVKRSKGPPQMETLFNGYFYPVVHYRDDEGDHHTTWRVHQRGKMREFTIPTGTLGGGGSTLMTELGRHGVVATPANRRVMESYIVDYMIEVQRKAEEARVYTRFGWQDDHSFVLGANRYLPNGEVVPARLGGEAANPDYIVTFNPRGTLKEWVDLVERTYNYPGQEQYQFMLGAGFGAPLLRLFENYGGVLLHGFSAEKGLGKSTAGKLALGIYGDPKKLLRSKQQVTIKNFCAHCGVLHNLPVLLDEATNIEPKELSELVYLFSTGAGRKTQTKDNRMNASLHGWSTLGLTTANRSLIHTLGAANVNADAEMGRVIEFPFAKVSTLSKLEADEILSKSELTYGHAGVEFIKYVVTHRKKVAQALRVFQADFDSRLTLTTQDRFVSVGVAAVLCGVSIAKKLGLVDFDVNALRDWAVARMRDLRAQVVSALPGVDDTFGQFLAQHNDQILVTKREGDARASGTNAEPVKVTSGALVGRAILETNTLYISQSAVQKWCARNRADFVAMQERMQKLGHFKGLPTQYSLGKGLKSVVSSKLTCWVLDWSAVTGNSANDEAATLPTLAVVK